MLAASAGPREETHPAAASNERCQVARVTRWPRTAALNFGVSTSHLLAVPHSLMVEEWRVWRWPHPYILEGMITPDSRRERVTEHRAFTRRWSRGPAGVVRGNGTAPHVPGSG